LSHDGDRCGADTESSETRDTLEVEDTFEGSGVQVATPLGINWIKKEEEIRGDGVDWGGEGSWQVDIAD